MIDLLLFLIVIGVLIFVHELGHFLAAKACGIQVDAFALGFGPKIVSFKKGETEYRLNILPFGGYVKMAGEGDYGGDQKNPRGFEVQHPMKKIIVILAGVCMNFLLACVIYTAFLTHFSFAQYVPQVVRNTFPFGTAADRVGFAVDSQDTTSPIYKYHLGKTYIFEKINNTPITTISQVADVVSTNKGKPIILMFVDTNGENQRTITVTPRTIAPKDKGVIGIILTPVTKLYFSGWQKPISGVLYSVDMLQYNVSALVTLIHEAIQTKTASVVTNNITGPVGIYEVTGAVYQQSGVIGIINIIALLSLALALMNILPLPVLDGGYALIILIETVIRRKINAKAKNWITNIGVGFLILLMVFVTYNDVINFNVLSQITHIFHK